MNIHSKNFSKRVSYFNLISLLTGALVLMYIVIPISYLYLPSNMKFITTAHAATTPLDIWWPTNGTVLSNTHPLKIMQQNFSIYDYNSYWQVDGGNLVPMYNSLNDYPHKEALVNFDSWNWNSNGIYKITFISKDLKGNEIGRNSVSIEVKNLTTPVAPTTPANNPSLPLFVEYNNSATAQAEAWKYSRPRDAEIMKKLGSQSTAKWFGDWNSNIESDVNAYVSNAKENNSMPVLIAYNIPIRDCGSYSSGGANSVNSYTSWIKKFSQGIGQNKAIIILEPDAIASIDCLSARTKTERYNMLKNSVETFKNNNPGALVYLDAGHTKWIDSTEMARRLSLAGIANAKGFSLNVSNFFSTSENITYGNSVSSKVSGAHYVIDTSRNGSGSNGEWCNPSGRSLGSLPTLSTGSPLVDAFLWIKVPGESDGSCNGGPNAGAWWPEYALDLAKRAGY